MFNAQPSTVNAERRSASTWTLSIGRRVYRVGGDSEVPRVDLDVLRVRRRRLDVDVDLDGLL